MNAKQILEGVKAPSYDMSFLYIYQEVLDTRGGVKEVVKIIKEYNFGDAYKRLKKDCEFDLNDYLKLVKYTKLYCVKYKIK